MSTKSPAEGKPWGKITWYFIHTFCERINETFFVQNKEKVINILSNVCSMIPCPTCRAHASQYLKKNPMMKMIRNKEDLKAYFFRFHNQATLNGNPAMRPAEPGVLEMYKRANFSLIIKAFSAEYMKNTPTRQDYSHTMFSQRILKSTVDFVYAHQKYFVPEAPQQPQAPPQQQPEQEAPQAPEQQQASDQETITMSIVE